MILVAILLTLVIETFSERVRFIDSLDVQDYTAFNYHFKIGLPLAKDISQVEDHRNDDDINSVEYEALKKYYYQVGLIIDLVQTTEHSVCAGVILTNSRILTAAHCWYDGKTQAWRFTVVAGSSTLFHGGQRIHTSEVIMHSSWNPALIRDDIAIANIYSLVLNETVGAISLPTSYEQAIDFANRAAVASVFGFSFNNYIRGFPQRHFMTNVGLSVIKNDECMQRYGNFIVSTNICANRNVSNICHYASGAPLVVFNVYRFMLIGIGSFGPPLDCMYYPQVFTRVSLYIKWIQDRI